MTLQRLVPCSPKTYFRELSHVQRSWSTETPHIRFPLRFASTTDEKRLVIRWRCSPPYYPKEYRIPTAPKRCRISDGVQAPSRFPRSLYIQ